MNPSVINHVALLVPNAVKSAEYLRQFDFKIGPAEKWDGEGTLEVYVGDLNSEMDGNQLWQRTCTWTVSIYISAR